MSNTKHTPGPWKISETENYAEIYGAIPNLPAIALVQSSPEDIRLIAASPEMLDLLRSAQWAIDCESDENNAKLVTQIEDLISKINGINAIQ